MKHKLESVLCDVSRWYHINKFSVHLKKTHLMFIGTSALLEQMSHVQVRLDDIDIGKVELFKYLGLTPDTHLSFKDHVDYIKRKTFSKICLLVDGRLRSTFGAVLLSFGRVDETG